MTPPVEVTPFIASWLTFAMAIVYLMGAWLRPLAYVGLSAQIVYMIWRGVELGRLPLVGVHDTLGFLAMSCMAFGLAVIHAMRQTGNDKRDRDLLLSVVAIMAGVFSFFASMQMPKSGYLPPVLRTYWFELHVGVSFFSYALFGIAAALGVLYLIRGNPAYERLEYKTAFIGYGFFSVSMIFGGVWAHLAWGTYWLWTPKELWTSLLWIFYSLYLHMRLYPPMRGRPAAIIGIVGYAVVLFTYLGVGLLMKSSHSF